MKKLLTTQDEIERAKGIKDFCSGKPFNINKSEAWVIGWKEMAAKFRGEKDANQCSAWGTYPPRRCMRGARINGMCTVHARLAEKRTVASAIPVCDSPPQADDLWMRHEEMKMGLYAMVEKRRRQGRDAETLQRSIEVAIEQDAQNIRAMTAHA